MKKIMICILSLMLSAVFFGCNSDKGKSNKIDHLNIVFAPLSTTEEVHKSSFDHFTGAISQQLVKDGHEIENYNCYLAASEREIIDGLSSGKYDVGFVSLKALHELSSDEYVVISAAGVTSLNVDTDDISYWNDRESEYTARLTGYIRSAFFVNTASAYGKQLYEKATTGILSFKDFADARIYTGSNASDIAFIYPEYYLKQHYSGDDVSLNSIENLTVNKTYSACVEALFRQQCDIIIAPGDIRLVEDSQESFASLLSSKALKGETIFDYMKVIGVSEPIYNKVFAVRKGIASDQQLLDHLREAVLNYGNDQQYGEFLQYYGYQGVVKADNEKMTASMKAYDIFKTGE